MTTKKSTTRTEPTTIVVWAFLKPTSSWHSKGGPKPELFPRNGWTWSSLKIIVPWNSSPWYPLKFSLHALKSWDRKSLNLKSLHCFKFRLIWLQAKDFPTGVKNKRLLWANFKKGWILESWWGKCWMSRVSIISSSLFKNHLSLPGVWNIRKNLQES